MKEKIIFDRELFIRKYEEIKESVNVFIYDKRDTYKLVHDFATIASTYITQIKENGETLKKMDLINTVKLKEKIDEISSKKTPYQNQMSLINSWVLYESYNKSFISHLIKNNHHLITKSLFSKLDKSIISNSLLNIIKGNTTIDDFIDKNIIFNDTVLKTTGFENIETSFKEVFPSYKKLNFKDYKDLYRAEETRHSLVHNYFEEDQKLANDLKKVDLNLIIFDMGLISFQQKVMESIYDDILNSIQYKFDFIEEYNKA